MVGFTVPKIGFNLMQVKGDILRYFLPSLSYHLSLRSFLSIFEWPLKTGFAVSKNPILAASSCTHMRICVHVGTPLTVNLIEVHVGTCIRYQK